MPAYLCHICLRLCLLCMHNPLQSVSVCIWQSVHACVCSSVCVWGAVFPGLLVIMFLGVMGGTWKPCAAQIKTNKEMMGAPLSPLWPGGPRGGRERETGQGGKEEEVGGRERERKGESEGRRRRRRGGVAWLPLWFVKNALPPKSNGKLLRRSKTHRAEEREKGGVEGRAGEKTVDRCVNRKEVGKRKGGVTCIDMLLDMKREGRV